MKIRHILTLLIISGITGSFMQCTKEAERDFARVMTLDASKISQNGATINGEVLNPDVVAIEECGFYIYTGTPSESTFAGIVVADYNTESGQFSYIIETDLVDGHFYYYEAYAKTNPVLSVGNHMVFESMGSTPPTPVGISPESGQAGDTIKLILEKDILISIGYTVDFDGHNADIVGFEGSTLEVVVPKMITSLENTVSITFNNQTISFEDKFTVLSPEVTSFSPPSVYSGQFVTIEGNNFNKITSLNIVRFDETIADVISSTQTSLVVIAPNIISSEASISIEVSGQIVTATETIEVLEAPVIWEQVSNFPGGESYKSGAFVIGDYGYVGLGTGISHAHISGTWRFDPTLNNWEKIADFPGNTRINPYGFTLDGTGYMGGGFDEDAPWRVPLKDFYKYDPTIDSWSSIEDYIYTADGHFGGISETVGGKAYISFTQSDFYSLTPDLSTIWNDLGIPGGNLFTFSSSFVLENKIYFVSGMDYYESSYSSEVWAYDTESNIWERKNDFPGGSRYGGIGFAVNDKGYIGLGYSGTSFNNDIWEYDETSDSWTYVAAFPGGARASAFSFIINNYVFIGGGAAGNTFYNDVYKFNPGALLK